MTRIQPDNPDVPHMCFVRKKNELFEGEKGNCHLVRGNGKCNLTAEIHILKNIPLHVSDYIH